MKRFYQYLNSISWKQALVYYFLLIVIFGAILTFFSSLFSASMSDSINFGLGISGGMDNFPEELLISKDNTINWVIFISTIILGVVVLIIKIFFESMVVVKMMRPPVSLGISKFFVLNSNWGRNGEKYFTIRVLNETQFTLLQVAIKAVLVVKEKSIDCEDEMKWYFDIEGNTNEIDPSEISIFTPYTPWTYCLKSSLEVSNSVKNYTLEEIITSEKLENIERSIDLIITGNEATDGTEFVEYQSIKLDAWDKANGYKKFFKEGHFESLPLEMRTDFHRINNVVEQAV